MGDRREVLTAVCDIAMLALATLFFLEGARELVGTVYNFNLSSMEIGGSVGALAAFVAPAVLLLFVRSAPPRVHLASSAVGIAFSRLFLSAGLPASWHLVPAAAIVGLSGVFFAAFLSEHRLGVRAGRSGVGIALAVGVGLDIASRALGGTFGVLVNGFDGTVPQGLLLTAPFVACFGAAVGFSLWKGGFEPRDEEDAGEDDPTPLTAWPLHALGLGGLLFVYSSLLGNWNVISRWNGGDAALVAGAGGLSLAAVAAWCAFRPSAPAKTGRIINAISGILVFMGIAATAQSIGVWVGPLTAATLGPALLLAEAFVADLVPGGETAPSDNAVSLRLRRLALVGTGAGGVFVVLAFASVLSLTWAHVPGAGPLKGLAPAILVVGALVAAVPGVFIRTDDSVGTWSPLQRGAGGTLRSAASLAVVFAIVAVAVAGSFAYSRPQIGEGASDGVLVVATYNIHQGYGMDGRMDPWEILAPLESSDADVVFLQESDCGRLTSMNADLVLWLAERLGMHSFFGPGTGEGIYGVAILSRFPLEVCGVTFLTSVEDQRVMVRTEAVVNGTRMAFYNVHMGLSAEDRTAQSSEIVGIFSTETLPFILGGDFNTHPDESCMENVTAVAPDAWTLAGKDPFSPDAYTFDSTNPYERIDYILVSPGLASCVADCNVMTGYQESDHLPVVASIRV